MHLTDILIRLPAEIRDEILSLSILGNYKRLLVLGQVCRSWKQEVEIAKHRYSTPYRCRSQNIPFDIHPVLAELKYEVNADFKVQSRLITIDSAVLGQAATFPPTPKLLFRLSYDFLDHLFSDIEICRDEVVSVQDIFEEVTERLQAPLSSFCRQEAADRLQALRDLGNFDSQVVYCYPPHANFRGFKSISRDVDGTIILATNEVQVGRRPGSRESIIREHLQNVSAASL